MKNCLFRINVLMLAVVLAVGLIVLSPAHTAEAVVGGGCTAAYMSCIDAAYDFPDPERQMYYLECAASYFGCMRAQVIGM